MSEHHNSSCPEQTEPCEYCGVLIPRKSRSEHMAQSQPHIEYLVQKAKNLEIRLAKAEASAESKTQCLEKRLAKAEAAAATITSLEKKISSLVAQNAQMQETTNSLLLNTKQKSFIWRLKYSDRSRLRSCDFRFRGYVFGVLLQQAETGLGLFFELRKGDKDDVLPWPFNGVVRFQIINPNDKTRHRESPQIDTAIDEKGDWEKPKGPISLGCGFVLVAKTDIPEYLRDGVMTIKTSVALRDEWL
eukprot:TRINITY_DN9624_c0_g1_i1.p1 TRINITY_DN9624_c0_g1~~TRINITY_DN9624_c0_g1_i1.p1  ORF type:complete len:245 (-),score=40.18 TRINITY_DN9624_c0_g1_i1:94-828(-)